jgi:hypothetical protein
MHGLTIALVLLISDMIFYNAITTVNYILVKKYILLCRSTFNASRSYKNKLLDRKTI